MVVCEPRGAAAAAALITFAGVVTISPPAYSTTVTVTCATAQVPLGLGGEEMAGTLCQPAGGPSTVVVLVPGATYDQTYWNFPYDPDTYNFRLALNRTGYSTFALDRLGTGASSKPLSLLVTSSAQAAAIHDVITSLRRGAIGPGFSHVVLAGHSMGSVESVVEASTYHDEDALLLTGFSHDPNLVNLAGLVADLYPAGLDPVTAPTGYSVLDPTYLTTDPGTRAAQFYGANYDPEVLAVDEVTKSVVSSSEPLDGVPLSLILPATSSIAVPVLVVDGADDRFFCSAHTCASSSALLASEAPDYSAAPCLSAYVLPGAGHDVNLAPNTGLYQSQVASWLDALPAQWTSGTCPLRT